MIARTGEISCFVNVNIDERLPLSLRSVIPTVQYRWKNNVVLTNNISDPPDEADPSDLLAC